MKLRSLKQNILQPHEVGTRLREDLNFTKGGIEKKGTGEKHLVASARHCRVYNSATHDPKVTRITVLFIKLYCN